jgi:hypothetical protein
MTITAHKMEIDTLIVHAPSVLDAYRLADALPAALARAFEAANRDIAVTPTQHAADPKTIEIGAEPHARGLADRVATQVVAAALDAGRPR